MRFLVLVVLTALLCLLQAHLWRQDDGVFAHHTSLENKLLQEKENTKQLNMRNVQQQAEIQDLSEGTEVIEELARRELKMLKSDEVLIQFK